MVNKFLYPHGGSETYMLKLGKYLMTQGHEVQYFGMEDDQNIVGNTANSYTDNVNFHNKSFVKSILNPFKVVYSLKSRKKIRNVLDDFKPDVVHLNNFNFQITPSIIYEIGKDKLPIIYTAHDFQLICPNHLLYDRIRKATCEDCLNGKFRSCLKRKCIHGSLVKSFLGTMEAVLYRSLHTYKSIDVVICPSYFMENKLLTNKDFRGKTMVMHNFIDSATGRAEEKEDYVLYFGRFSEEKGLEKLIRVCKELSNIKFVFAGEGPLEGELSNIPNIINVGFLEHESLVDWIGKARFTLCTSEWYENCPFSIIESFMYGTPVIGANIGGIPELIHDGRTGLLYECGDIVDLKNKIITLWNDLDLCQELTMNCSNIEFDTVDIYSKKLIEVYERTKLEQPNREQQITGKLEE